MSSGIICWAVMPSRNIPAGGGDNFYAAAWLGNKGRWWAYKRFLAQKNGPPVWGALNLHGVVMPVVCRWRQGCRERNLREELTCGWDHKLRRHCVHQGVARVR